MDAALWWTARLLSSYDLVGALLPEGYEAYGRLLHPGKLRATGTPIRWQVVATNNGRVVHAQMRFSSISRRPGSEDNGEVQAPSPSLPIHEAGVLVEILRAETSTPEMCWFCRSPYDPGEVDDQGVIERVTTPSGGRGYLLHQGSIDLALAPPPLVTRAEYAYVASRTDLNAVESAQEVAAWRASRSLPPDHARVRVEGRYYAPTFWWPEDRAWFVATEPDLASTYIGGRERAIARLASDSRLEVLEARLTDDLSTLADVANEELDRSATQMGRGRYRLRGLLPSSPHAGRRFVPDA